MIKKIRFWIYRIFTKSSIRVNDDATIDLFVNKGEFGKWE